MQEDAQSAVVAAARLQLSTMYDNYIKTGLLSEGEAQPLIEPVVDEFVAQRGVHPRLIRQALCSWRDDRLITLPCFTARIGAVAIKEMQYMAATTVSFCLLCIYHL